MSRPAKPTPKPDPLSTLNLLEQNVNKSRETVVAEIEDSFAAATDVPVHPTQPHLTAKRIIPVFPDFERWGNQLIETVFDADPYDAVGSSKEAARLSFLQTKDKQQDGPTLSFLRPDFESIMRTKDFAKSESVDEERIMASKFEWVRDYRPHVSQLHDSFLLYTTKDNAFAYYNEISAKVTLSRLASSLSQDELKAKRAKKIQFAMRQHISEEDAVRTARMRMLDAEDDMGDAEPSSPEKSQGGDSDSE